MSEPAELDAKPHIADEITDQKVSGGGRFLCPVCGESAFYLVWEGALTSLDEVCGSCGSDLLAHSVVFIPTEYRQEHGDPSTDELRKIVTAYWESELRQGISITRQRFAGREPPTDEHIEYSPMTGREEVVREPPVKTEEREQDITGHMAREYQYRAEQFGWDWEPPKGVGE